MIDKTLRKGNNMPYRIRTWVTALSFAKENYNSFLQKREILGALKIVSWMLMYAANYLYNHKRKLNSIH